MYSVRLKVLLLGSKRGPDLGASENAERIWRNTGPTESNDSIAWGSRAVKWKPTRARRCRDF
jgi:hypothetical protein